MQISARSGFAYVTNRGMGVSDVSSPERTASRELDFRIKSSTIITAGAFAMGAMWMYSVAQSAPTWKTVYIVVMLVTSVVALSIYVEYLAGGIGDWRADDAFNPDSCTGGRETPDALRWPPADYHKHPTPPALASLTGPPCNPVLAVLRPGLA